MSVNLLCVETDDVEISRPPFEVLNVHFFNQLPVIDVYIYICWLGSSTGRALCLECGVSLR